MSVPLPAINSRLLPGDKKRIANSLNCSAKMVYLVLTDKRGKRRTELVLDILKKATEIGNNNENLNLIPTPQTIEA